ncbi:hypothetical protein Tco_0509481, partial [Tanacetum coccineum]
MLFPFIDLLGDLNEPANYKAALSDPEFEKWLVAMNEEMQSINDNKVWKLVVLPPNAKVVKKAEYIAASEAAKEAVWIRKFIDELGVVPSNDYPIKKNSDNLLQLHKPKESGIQKRRHFQRKYHYVRECIKTGEIDIVKVHTDENLVDPFTKALAGPKLTRHARSMGLRPASSFR